MSRYDDLFADLVENDSVFADKSELDPLAESEEIIPRTEQERALATSLTGVTEGYLPTTGSVYGPPSRGRTITTRRLWREFAERTAEFGVEYVNLKECRMVFNAANEILFALGGEKRGARRRLQGALGAPGVLSVQ